MKPIGAIVTGVGAPVGVSIIKALREAALPVRVIAVDAEPLAQGFFMADRACVVPPARPDPDAYFEALVAVARSEGAQILFSGWEGELPMLAARKAEFEHRTGAILPMAPGPAAIALDKWLTVSTLAGAGVGVPDSVLPDQAGALEGFFSRHRPPWIIKPRRGSGSQGVALVRSREELALRMKLMQEPVVQEHLLPETQEYTVGVVLDGQACPRGALPLRRSLSGGLSYRMESDGNATAADEAARAAAALGLVGPVNVQLRLTADGPRVFEINPRCSSATCVRARFGLNEPEGAIRLFVLGEAVQPPAVRTGVCLRHWEERYLSDEEAAAARAGRHG